MKAPQKIRVLFVCLGNSCRSPMAEAIARQDAPDLWEVSSGGLTPLGFVAELTIETLAKNNYRAGSLDSKPVMHAHWQEVDLVINMSGIEKHSVFEEYGKVEDWMVEDPYDSDPETYQRVFEDIRARVTDLAGRLRNSHKANSSPAKLDSAE
ncbi:MAG: low molecular weight phosphatase family protein [Acidobacteria bacterium]|nr:low molecular weight phosphatase family protein [Acidobacteriota bacterium]MBS1867668.1 low molecular weight phosphatase family protein [Acidobacteriota bacterium]